MPTTFPSPVKLTSENRDALVASLYAALCDGIDFYNAAKIAHWHTKGPFFGPLHALFGELADTVSEVNDDIAERIITLGALTPATTRAVAAKSSLPEIPLTATGGLDLVRILSPRFQLYHATLQTAYGEADLRKEAGTIDLVGGVLRRLEKAGWQLLSHLEPG